MPLARQGKSCGSVDVQVLVGVPLQGYVVVMVNVTLGGLGSPVLGEGMKVHCPVFEQPRRRPPSDPQLMTLPRASRLYWNGMPGSHVSVSHFDSPDAPSRWTVLFCSV